MSDFFDDKPFYKSKTFLSAAAGCLLGIFRLIGGIKSGDTNQMTEGATQIVGFYGMWRLRKGFWVGIKK